MADADAPEAPPSDDDTGALETLLRSSYEATLKVVGPHGTKFDGVGKQLRLGHGVYRITMVGQAPDDNHLTLKVA